MPPPPASWPLTFWPWKWCPSHVWRGHYLCANFSLPMPLCSRLRPDVHDRQTDVRCASSLNAPAVGGVGITSVIWFGSKSLQNYLINDTTKACKRAHVITEKSPGMSFFESLKLYNQTSHFTLIPQNAVCFSQWCFFYI